MTDLKYHHDPAAWVNSGEPNAMKNYARCNERLAAMPSEVNVQFLALLRRPFDRTQRPVCGG